MIAPASAANVDAAPFRWTMGRGGELSSGLPGEFAGSGGSSSWTQANGAPGDRSSSQGWWNVFAAGKLLATYNTTGTYYDLTDWLGTKRVEVNAALTCETGFRSLPYGNGLSSYAPTALPQCVDATEQHYTGKERDAESGNDYFEARYYASGFGRFMSPDWSAKEEPVPYAKLESPQSLNLYAYMEGNPLHGTDTDGHAGDICKQSGTDCSGRAIVTKNESEGSVTAKIGTTSGPVKEFDAKGNLKSITTSSTITTQTTDYNGNTTTTQSQSVTKQVVDAKGKLGPERMVSGYSNKTISQFDQAAENLRPYTVGLQHRPLGGLVSKIMDALGLKGGSLAGAATNATGVTIHNLMSTGDKTLDDALRE